MRLLEQVMAAPKSNVEELAIDDNFASLAADFVECEVGQFDFINNWANIKKRASFVADVEQWLMDLGINRGYAPELIAAIDKLAIKGGWHASFLC